MRIAVLGAGVMGRNIVRVFLRAGHEVALFSRTEATHQDALAALEGEPGAPTTTGSVAEAVAGAGLVLESVPERIDLKLVLLDELEAAVGDDAIIATNTSSRRSPGSRRGCGGPSGSWGCIGSTPPT